MNSPPKSDPSATLEEIEEKFNENGVSVDLQTAGQLSVPGDQMPAENFDDVYETFEEDRQKYDADIVVFTSTSANKELLVRGKALMGGDYLYVKTDRSTVLAHEIGHNLGLLHT